jgi:hypothetical protein
LGDSTLVTHEVAEIDRGAQIFWRGQADQGTRLRVG